MGQKPNYKTPTVDELTTALDVGLLWMRASVLAGWEPSEKDARALLEVAHNCGTEFLNPTD